MAGGGKVMSENQEPDAVGRDENKGNLGMAIPK